MGWEFWLVPLIALAVWILGSLLRGGMDDRLKNANRPNAGGPEGGSSSQRPATDLERFLQEVHRRRQAAEERERIATVEPPRPSPAILEVRPQPKPPKPIRQPSRRASRAATTPAKRPSRPKSVEEVEVVEVVRERTAETVRSVELPPVVVTAAVPALARSVPVARSRTTAGPPPSLAPLLSSPEGLRSAFILREILAPPLCKRKV